jgi:hypothetical protein
MPCHATSANLITGAARAAQMIWSEPVGTAPPEPELEAAVNGEPEPPFDPDDLDTPAYLRQGGLLN